MSAGGPPATAVGVDLGGTKLLGVLLDSAGDVLVERRAATPRGGAAIVAALAELVTGFDDERSTPGEHLPLGVGVPGLVDRSGTIRFSPNLPGVVDLAVRAELQARWPGRRVIVENDATAAAWGERSQGAARNADNVLMVTLGTGIGGGLVSGGCLVRGAHGFAGEIGHMVVDPGGPLCPCGQSGCWERYASGSGLGRLGREAAEAGLAERLVELAGGDPEAVRGEHVSRAAEEGDPGGLAVMERFGWWLALGIANLVNAFDPELVVIGGGVVSAADVLLDPTRRAFATLVEGGQLRPGVPIVAAELGERAGAVGVAVLARWSDGGGPHGGDPDGGDPDGGDPYGQAPG
jgi:glucokinase